MWYKKTKLYDLKTLMKSFYQAPFTKVLHPRGIARMVVSELETIKNTGEAEQYQKKN